MRSRTRRSALCLCVALLSLGALGATSAQAANWMTEGAELKEGQLPKITVSGHGKLLFGAFGVHVTVLCKGVGTVGGHLVWGFIPRILASIRGSGCTLSVRANLEAEEKLLAACEPTNLGEEAGVFLTKELEGPLTLVSKEGVIFFEPKSGETIGTIEMGEECSLGESIPIIGKIALKDIGGTTNLEKEAKIHTLVEGPGTELWAISKTAEHKATLGGEFKTELESGGTWSGLPG